MKEITLQDILNMPPQELVDFFTSLDMEERLTFYNSLLDRHKDYFADQIESVMGARKFSDIAEERGISGESSFEELEKLATEENDPAAQYFLARYYLDKWNTEHPYELIGEDYVNDEPTLDAIKNDWEDSRKWAIECAEQNFNQGLYAQALCYDRVTYPRYYTKKLIRDFDDRFAVIRYEAVVVEKHDREIALATAVRLGEIYAERDFDELHDIDEMRRELQRYFEYKCRVHAKEKSPESREQAEYALDNLRYYDERRISAADRMMKEHPEFEKPLSVYREFHQRLLDELN